jgi:hypothetical protein
MSSKVEINLKCFSDLFLNKPYLTLKVENVGEQL